MECCNLIARHGSLVLWLRRFYLYAFAMLSFAANLSFCIWLADPFLIADSTRIWIAWERCPVHVRSRYCEWQSFSVPNFIFVSAFWILCLYMNVISYSFPGILCLIYRWILSFPYKCILSRCRCSLSLVIVIHIVAQISACFYFVFFKVCRTWVGFHLF